MFNEVFFSDVFVPDEDVVGPVNGGWTVATCDPRQRAREHRRRRRCRSLGRRRLDLRHARPSDGRREDRGRKHVAEEQTLKLLNLRSAERAVAGGEPGPKAT